MARRCLWRAGEIYAPPLLDMASYFLSAVLLFRHRLVGLCAPLDVYAVRASDGTGFLPPCPASTPAQLGQGRQWTSFVSAPERQHLPGRTGIVSGDGVP